MFDQSGNKHGILEFNFYICQTSTDKAFKIFGSGRIEGDFKIICAGLGKIKAPRLLEWWNSSEDHSLEFALHCAAHIGQRGIKYLPPMTLPPMTPTHTTDIETKIKLLEAVADAASELLNNIYEVDRVDKNCIIKLKKSLDELGRRRSLY